MAKLLVTIEVEGSAEEWIEELEKNREDYFPMGDNRISVDNAYLKHDPNDDSFYLFELKGVIDEEAES